MSTEGEPVKGSKASQGAKDGKDPWSKENKNKFQNSKAFLTRFSRHSKSRSEYFDPCQEAAERSIRCLNRNGGDRKMCSDYFEAYRNCKKEWTERRKKEKTGIFW
ncbi:Mitochondrial copper homeostasis protein [Apiospora aurea]|uniref:Mitochondrial copper homeostasis protein n=1 Tax=Apiospora aurea TaxID=335848 RepID=A0ABR1PUS0_9PEZI